MDKEEMDREYVSECYIYYPKGDSSLRAGAKYLADTLSSEQRKVFFEYATNHTSAGASFRKGDKNYRLKRSGGDYIIS